jgi:hypothetical protein
MRTISTEREFSYQYYFIRLLILFSHVDPRLTQFHPTPGQISTRWKQTRPGAMTRPEFAKQARFHPEVEIFRTEKTFIAPVKYPTHLGRCP